MITSLCKRVTLLAAGAALLLSGCAVGDRWETLAPVQWAGTDQQGGREGISWTDDSGGGQWAGLKVAVFPVHNMTSLPGPLEEMERLFYSALRKSGVQVLERETLEKFMAEKRMRYTGGIDSDSASALREGTGVEAVLITSLEHYDEGVPPRISLHARLVAIGKDPEIRWVDSYCRAGDDTPGFLSLGIIDDDRELMKEAIDELARSMLLHLTGRNTWRNEADTGRNDPTDGSYRPEEMGSETPITIAVMPFLNLSERSYAWEILPLHFVQEMTGLPGIRILEPGEVRRALLRSRVFLQGGLSLPQLELVLRSTEADLVLTGTVMRYLDTRTMSRDPEVEFSLEMFHRIGKKVVWASRQAGTGGDGVFFFDVGRKSTACGLAQALVNAAVSEMPFQAGDPENTTVKEGVMP